jgi:hypothetical protein
VRAQGAQVRLLRVWVRIGVAVELEVDARLLGEGDTHLAQGLQPFGMAVNDDHLRGRFGSGQRVEELHLPHRAPRAEQQQAVALAQGSVARVAVGVGNVPATRAHHQQAVVVQPTDIDGHGGHRAVAGEAECAAVAQGVLRGFQHFGRRVAENQDVGEAVGRVGVA